MALEKNIGHSVETFLRKVAGDLSSHCQISLFWKPSHTFTMLFKTQSSYTTFQGISLIKYPSKEFSSHRNFLIQHTHPHTKFFLILNVGMSLHLVSCDSGLSAIVFPILARKLQGQLSIYQGWREAEVGDTVSRDKREGLKGREGWSYLPSTCPNPKRCCLESQ